MADGQNITNSIGIETSKAVDNVKTLQAQLRELTDTMSKTVALGKEVPAAMTEQANVLTSQIEALKSSYGKGAEAQEQYQQRTANAVLKANEKASAAEEKRLQSALQSMDKESQKLADAEAKKYRSRKEWNDKAAENTSKRAQSEEEALQSALRRMDVARDKEIAADTARYQRRADIERVRQEKGAQIIAKQQAQEAALTAKGDEAALQSALRRMNERSAAEDAMMQQRQAKWTEWNRQNAENTAERAAMNNIVAPGHSAEELSAFAKLPSYAEQMRTLNTEAEKLYRVWKQTGDVNDRIAFRNKASELSALNGEMELFNKKMGIAADRSSLLDQFLIKAKSHAAWIMTGAMIAGGIGLFDTEIESAVKFEQAMAGIKQVMPEIDGVGKTLDEAAVAQHKANEEEEKFIGIAARYGQAAGEVMEAARSIGRMYGQGENGVANTNMLTQQAAKMATVDNFDMMQATRGMESALSQFGLQSEKTTTLLANSNRVLDVWTKLAHRGAASAQDLTEGVQQAGASAHQTGVSFEFLNALISVGVRETAKSGNEIGTALKSMFNSMQSDKSIKALKEFGINVYKVGEDGKKSFRSMQDIILDTSLAIQTTDKSTSKLLLTLAGGKYQVSKVSAILTNYQEILRTLAEANSSKGFTNKQIEVQMETLSRKLAALKANLQGVAVAFANNGGMASMKSLVDHMNNIVVGLGKMDDKYSKWVERIVYLTVILKGVPALVSRIAAVWGGMVMRFQQAGAANVSLLARMKQWTTHWTTDAVNVGKDTAAIKANTAAKQQNAAAGRVTRTTTTSSANPYSTSSVIVNNGAAKAAAETKTFADAERMAAINSGLLGNATLGARMKVAALAQTERAAAAATSLFATVSRGASGVVAAFGGPIGIAITALAVLTPMLLANADAQGEVANKSDQLSDAVNNAIASSQQAYQEAQRQEEICIGLAERYNALKGSLSKYVEGSKEYNKITEEMGSLQKTVDQIMGDSAVQFDENGKLKLDVIRSVADQNKEAAKNQILEEKDKLEADKEATAGQITDTEARIKAMEQESESVHQLGEAWRWLYGVIAAGLRNRAEAMRQAAQDYKDSSNLADTTGTWANGGLAGTNEDNSGYFSNVEPIANSLDETASKLENTKGAEWEGLQNKIAAASSQVEALKGNLTETDGRITQLAEAYAEVDKASNDETKRDGEVTDKEDDKAAKKAARDAEKAEKAAEREAKKEEAAEKKALNDQLKAINQTFKETKSHAESLLKNIEEQEKVSGVSVETIKAKDKILNDEQWALTELAKQAKEVRDAGGEDTTTTESTGSGQIGQSVIAMADSHPEREQWMGNITSDPSIKCDYFTANVYSQAGIPSIGGVDTSSSAINDSAFSAANAFHPVGDGYSPKPGDLVSFAGHVGIYMGNDEIISRQSSMGVHRASISEAESYFGAVQGYGSIGEATGLNNDPIENTSSANTQQSMQDDILKTARERVKLFADAIKGFTDNIEKASKHYGLLAKNEELKDGVNVTQIEKDNIELKKQSAILDSINTAMKRLDELGVNKNSDDYLSLMNRQLETQQTIAKLKNETTPEDTYKQKHDDIEYRKSMATASDPSYHNIFYDKMNNDRNISFAKEEVAALKEELDALEKEEGNVSQEVIKKKRVEYQQALKQLEEYQKNYNDKIKSAEYQVLDDLLIKGNSFKDIWKKLWNDLAEDALKALLRIPNGSGGIFSQLLGLFGGVSGGTSMSVTGATSATSTFITNGFDSLLSFGDGGVTDKPSIAGEDGEEVVIPVEKNMDNSYNLLAYAAKKLGTSSPVTATVSESTAKKSSELAVSGTQQNLQHLDKLDAQIELMQRQNEMLLHLINNGTGGSNGNTIMQPVVVSQQMDGTQFADMYSRAQRMRTIK